MVEYTRLIAGQLVRDGHHDLTLDDADQIAEASSWHDLGKSALPAELLERRGPLNAADRGDLRRHVEEGLRLMRGAFGLGLPVRLRELAIEIIESHHEFWDGQGYPRGLAGEQIPLSGRIVAVADVYDALRSERPYKPGFTHARARTLVLQQRGRQFDPVVVDAFVRVEPLIESLSESPRAGRRAA